MKTKILVATLALALCLTMIPVAMASETTGWIATQVVPFRYDSVGAFSEGLAPVGVGDFPNEKWGFINAEGQTIIPFQYDYADDFSDGLAVVRVNRKYGYINRDGEEVIPCRYDYAMIFSEGLAPVEVDGKYGFIDVTGQMVIPCQYDRAAPFFEGFAQVMRNGKFGFVDTTGKEVVPLKYSGASSFNEGLAAVYIGSYDEGRYGYVDTTGQEVIPCQYAYTWRFSDGLALARLDNYYRGPQIYIDKSGHEVLRCDDYDFPGDFSEGLAFGYLDTGEVDAEGYSVTRAGYRDKTGKIVFFCKHDYSGGEEFCGGLAWVWTSNEEDGDLWGLIDNKGKEIIPCQYHSVGEVSEGLAAVEISGKWGYISVSQADYTGTMEADGRQINYACAEDGAVVLSGDLASDELVMAAMYDDQGRFIGVEILSANKLKACLDTAAAKVKLFWLGDSQNPISTATTLWER